jgi:hypothetical protein
MTEPSRGEVVPVEPALPTAVTALFEHAITVEYTSLTRSGRPIMVPVTPYGGLDGTIDVSTGLTYPAKAERARCNPKVCLLFSDDVGSQVSDAPVVLVHGLATVRDADLQANTDRYVRETLAKVPAAFKGTPAVLLRRLTGYFARIWIEVTPTRIWWWESKGLDREPQTWAAAPGTTAPPSDPEPSGPQPKPWLPAPVDWYPVAQRAVARFEHADLAWVGTDGWPYSVPVAVADTDEAGFRIQLGPRLAEIPRGPACMTFHTHTPAFTTQENHTFVGQVTATDAGYIFHTERLLADVSLQGSKIARSLGFLAKVRRLDTRLQHEAARHGQPVPVVRLPQARPGRKRG